MQQSGLQPSENSPRNILIDASWWLGGNRNRGIGKYLEYLFLKDTLLKNNNFFWLFPKKLSKYQLNEFKTKFPGEVIEFETYQLLKNKEQRYKQLVAHFSINEVFLASPFERPWSLLQEIEFFDTLKIKRSAIIFDLIPLQLAKDILNTWPKYQQINYKNNIKKLKKIDCLYCISPFTQKAVEQLLNTKNQKVTLISFGLKTDWLEIPQTPFSKKNSTTPGSINLLTPVQKTQQKKKLKRAITISGGDPRKNLNGTLEYFAKKLAKDHLLRVICKLNWRERFQYRWQTWRLGIANKVDFLGEISEIRKWQYLRDSDIFLFLSQAEGLGIPLLEAKKAGINNFVLSKQLYEQGFAKILELPNAVVAD